MVPPDTGDKLIMQPPPVNERQADNHEGGDKMNKTVKLLGVATLLAAIIPLSAYAAASKEGKSDFLSRTEASYQTKNVQELDNSEAGKAGIVKKENGLGFDISAVFQSLGFDKQGFLEAVKSGRTLAELAANKDVPREQLISIVSAAIDNDYDQADQNGKLSQNDAAAYRANAKSAIDKLIDSPLTKFAQQKKGGAEVINLQPALDLLGIDKPTFVNAREAGKSLVDLAAEKGVTRQQLIDSLLAQVTQSLDDAVRNGKLSKEEAENNKQSALAQINKMINDNGTEIKKGKQEQK
jgi:hypothetical protein